MHIAVDPVSLRISAPLRQQLLRKFSLANFLTTLFCTIYLSGVGFAQDPASIANLEFWFRSDSGVTIVENKVAAWQSLVNDHVAGNSTVSRRPVLETEVFTEQEGVIFGGGQTGSFLNLNPVTFDSSFTIYSLFKVTDFNNAVQYLFGLSPGVRGFGITNNNQRLIFFDGGLQHEVAEALIEEVYYLI